MTFKQLADSSYPLPHTCKLLPVCHRKGRLYTRTKMRWRGKNWALGERQRPNVTSLWKSVAWRGAPPPPGPSHWEAEADIEPHR